MSEFNQDHARRSPDPNQPLDAPTMLPPDRFVPDAPAQSGYQVAPAQSPSPATRGFEPNDAHPTHQPLEAPQCSAAPTQQPIAAQPGAQPAPQTTTAATAARPAAVQPSTPSDRPSAVAAPESGYRVSFLRVLNSEWIKLRSLPSTWWTLGITFVVCIGFAAMMAWSMGIAHEAALSDPNSGLTPSDFNDLSALDFAGSALSLGQIVLLVLGVLTITNEYSSGMIRSTITAVPKRWQILASKALLVGVVTFVFSFVAAYLIQLITWPLIDDFGTDSRFALGTLRICAGLGLANALIVIMALAVGALLHNTAGSICAMIVLLYVAPNLLGMLHWDWAATLIDYLPGQVSQWLYFDGSISFPIALLVTCVWAFVPLIASGILMRKRDA